MPNAFGPDGLVAWVELHELDLPTIIVERLPLGARWGGRARLVFLAVAGCRNVVRCNVGLSECDVYITGVSAMALFECHP